MQISQSEKDTALFMGVVLMLQNAAMEHMGKVKNPLTDKIECNLEQAQYAIDTLDALVSKTKGNLSAEEDRFLTSILRDLKLNYIDELNKVGTPSSGQSNETSADETK